MDLLFSRYASPFSFIETMIQAGRFSEWVYETMKIVHDEREEKNMWEFFLHKVDEGSYQDFREGIKNDTNNQNMSAETIESTIQNSMDILNNFSPTGGE